MMNAKNTISCKEAARLASESLERRLTLKEQAALKGHLAVCTFCLNYERQIKALRVTLGNYAEVIINFLPPSSLSLSSEARERIKLTLREQTT